MRVERWKLSRVTIALDQRPRRRLGYPGVKRCEEMGCARLKLRRRRDGIPPRSVNYHAWSRVDGTTCTRGDSKIRQGSRFSNLLVGHDGNRSGKGERDGMKKRSARRKGAGSYLRAEEAEEAPAGETE